MTSAYTNNQTFTKMNFSIEPFPKGEIEACVFVDCNLSSIDLSECRFLETEFIGCDLSNANISLVSFQDVVFKDCKMLGLQFQDCNPFAFSASFENCQLDHASFFKANLKDCAFFSCQMLDVDFAEADLSKLDLVACNLKEARFDHSILEKTDFREARNYSIDPNNNRINEALFSAQGALGLLDIFDIKID
jgi:uncharacterized protein YjbI with pentapeptide repeats